MSSQVSGGSAGEYQADEQAGVGRIVIPTVKGFGVVNKAEIDVPLELSCFFDDPADVGNLISGSSAFSKTSLKM